jgi:hypothetical protein
MRPEIVKRVNTRSRNSDVASHGTAIQTGTDTGHVCPLCGAGLETAGALVLHEATAHGPTPEPDFAVAGSRTRRARLSRPTVFGALLTIAAWLVALVVLGLGGREVYRAVLKTTATTSAPQPSPTAKTTPPAAASGGRQAAPAPAHVSGASAAVAQARQRYVTVAAAWKTAMDHSHDNLSNPLSLEVWARYASALSAYDAGLRSIAFPASVQPIVATLLTDDAQMERYLDADASGQNCGCGTAPFTLKTKIAADVDRLHAALGLPSVHDRDEPGH